MILKVSQILVIMMKPQTVLMAEKVTRVTIGGSEHLSAAHPTVALSVPMNPTYNM